MNKNYQSIEPLLNKPVLAMNGAELLELLKQLKDVETKETVKYP